MSNDEKYTVGEPEFVGKMPERLEPQDLMTRATPPYDMKVETFDFPLGPKPKFKVYTVPSTECYRIPEGVAVPTTLQEAEAIMGDENLILDEDGLVDGEPLLIQGFFGISIGYVEIKEGQEPCAVSESGVMFYMLQFARDRPDPQPPRWVCGGSGNIAAIQKLDLTF